MTRAVLLGVLLASAAVAAAAWLVPSAYEGDLATPFRHRESAWATSEACRSCHPDHHASWARTFHRTMTQEATEASVQGAFDGREVTLLGVTARPVRRDGRYLIEYLDPATREVRKTLPILRTVGSRRYQQYLTQDPDTGDNYYRVPLLWHMGERRWIHLTGAFFDPDGQPFDRHLTMWNQNCIFCHNTGPVPGARNFDELRERERRGDHVDPDYDGRYSSSVAELGIACEACHGPGAEHARRNRDPARRYLLHLSGRPDPTIVNPARLSKERSVEVCGQCHGQRMPREQGAILEWLERGWPFRAGEDLASYIRPIWRDTPPPGRSPDDGIFRLRFWDDGTPRLTAYEYHGLLQSACYTKGPLTCLHCHTMHGGDVYGQLPPENRTNQACAPCHEAIARDVAGHSHHRADGPGAQCLECHMPRAIYGVLEIHRSHRIANPDPAAETEAARPDACTSCHLDRPAAWAADAMRRFWGGQHRLPARRGDGAPLELVASVAALHAGDPLQRAVAARLAARRDTGLAPAARAFLIPHLWVALHDGYPTIRWFARRSLLELDEELAGAGRGLALAEELEGFDYLGPAAERQARAQRVFQKWKAAAAGFPAPPEGALLDEARLPRMDAIRRLLDLQGTKVIQIGE
jgi:hypothetical protein